MTLRLRFTCGICAGASCPLLVIKYSSVPRPIISEAFCEPSASILPKPSRLAIISVILTMASALP